MLVFRFKLQELQTSANSLLRLLDKNTSCCHQKKQFPSLLQLPAAYLHQTYEKHENRRAVGPFSAQPGSKSTKTGWRRSTALVLSHSDVELLSGFKVLL